MACTAFGQAPIDRSEKIRNGSRPIVVGLSRVRKSIGLKVGLDGVKPGFNL